jgi:hypothetical protein
MNTNDKLELSMKKTHESAELSRYKPDVIQLYSPKGKTHPFPKYMPKWLAMLTLILIAVYISFLFILEIFRIVK